MHSLRQAIVVGLTTFGASCVGLLLQAIVPAQILGEARGTVGAMIGLITLLLALVLGFLVYTAFAVFSTQQSEAYSLGPVIIEFDLALEKYGPGGEVGRGYLRAALQRSRARFFGSGEMGPQPFTFEQTRAIFDGLGNYFDGLEPSNDRQRGLLNTARDLARRFNDTQMLMARQLAQPFPPHVLSVVVAWASALFLGNGLVAAQNIVTVLAHLAGATAVGSAILLILELSTPYTGLIRLSPVGIDTLLAVLGDAEAIRKQGPTTAS